MNFTGSIYVVNDFDVLRSSVYSPQCRIMALVDINDNSTTDLPNTGSAAALLPPYHVVSAELNNDMNAFTNLYIDHLMGKTQDLLICVAIAGALRGLNIILYVPMDEMMNLNFIGVLLNYINSVYGVTIGTQYNQFAPAPEMYDAAILNRLYLHDLISMEEYFVNYPPIVPIGSEILYKLIAEMGIQNGYPTEQEYIKFLSEYKERIKANNNQFLVRPMRRGGSPC